MPKLFLSINPWKLSAKINISAEKCVLQLEIQEQTNPEQLL